MESLHVLFGMSALAISALPAIPLAFVPCTGERVLMEACGLRAK